MKSSSRRSRKTFAQQLALLDERDLTRYTGVVLWTSTFVVIQAASFIPGLLPDDALFWRLVLGVPAIAIPLFIWFVTPLLSDRAFYWSTFCWLIPGMGVNFFMLQISPATYALIANLLIPVMFTGYFMRRRELVPLMFFATAIALSPLYTELPSEPQGIGAYLTVFVPTMWTIAIALHMQKLTIQNALNDVSAKALIDPLTGLANLRAIRKRTDEAFATQPSDGDNELYGLLLVDIDNFKSANTLHGHLGGDRALRCVADQLQRVAPGDSLVARVGGDEFAVLVPIKSRQRLPEVAEVFGAAVRAASVEMRLPGVAIDASVGVAIYPDDGRSLDTLMTVADKSMYAKKSQHKAKPVVAPVPAMEDTSGDPIWVDVEGTAATPGQLGERSSEQPSALRKWQAQYTLYARLSALGWLFGCATIALSMLVSGADNSHLTAALASLAGGVFLTTLMLIVNPEPGGRIHLAYDAITLAALILIISLTGGSQSPATPLVYLLAVFQAWFWSWKKLIWRVAGPAVVVLSPIAYEQIAGSEQWAVTVSTLYADVAVLMTLVFVMYFNQVYLRRIEKQSQLLASTDPLTGIPNRRAFNVFVQEQLEHCARGDRQGLAIVMIDLDNFKDVNTAHGHHAGDLLLCDIAEALVTAAREEDCVARVGGDEFAAVLPGAGIDGARALAQRFVQAVTDCTATNRDGTFAAVSASAGFALCPLHGDTLDDLVRSADDALMSVKQDGKGSARVSRLIVAI